MNLTDRRRPNDRRLTNLGPPLGFVERRLNMERRIFDLGLSPSGAGGFPGANQRTIVREGLRAAAVEGLELPA